MQITLGKTPDGQEVILTDEHPVCMSHALPCVAIGRGIEVVVRGNLDLIKTDRGLFDAARLVIEWLEAPPAKSKVERGLAFLFLSHCPEYL